MNYDKATLRATAEKRIAEWNEYGVQVGIRDQAKYEAELTKWIAEEKPKAIEALQNALKEIKANKRPEHVQLGYNDGMRLATHADAPPIKPSAPGHVCNTIQDQLRGLIGLLDTISSEQISSNQLVIAGYKNISHLLRVPC
jgi:hypothetical protein